MNAKIEIMGISADTCSVEEIIKSINAHWNQKDSLSTYGVLNMKLLMAAQKDEELKGYIEMLDKTVADETEVLQAAGIEDRELVQETSQHGFLGTLFWLLAQYRNHIFLLGENQEDTEDMFQYLHEKYPDIIIAGKDSLQGGGADQVDRVINEINSLSPQAVLSCSRTYEMEKFVKNNRKMINTRVWFSLGNCLEILKSTGLKPAWLEKIMEKNLFKKMVSSYKEEKKEM